MRTPAQGMPFRATFIRSADVRAAVSCGRRRVLRSAAVEGHVAVAKRYAGLREVEDRIVHAVSVKIRDGGRASSAAAELRTGVQRYPTKDVRARAGKGMGHRSAKAETGCKDARAVDAQIAEDLLENVVGESHVTTIGVGPAGVEALWCHENGA